MKRDARTLFSALILILSISCTPWEAVKQSGHPATIHGSFASEKNWTHGYQTTHEHKPNEIASGEHSARVTFRDHTQEILGHAHRLIEKNEKEGAVLDQRWYTLKRFGKHQDLIFNAAKVIFYGGREDDLQMQLEKQYNSVVPVEDDQEPGEIRLFRGQRRDGPYDFIIIGQNGKEVALKTIIRLLYLTKFVDEKTKQRYGEKLKSFNKSLQIFMSSVSAREEFIAFFKKHGISNPDAVMIGFSGDTRSVMSGRGIKDPHSYSDESLRVNWYTDVNGKKILVVSINNDRIFASRSGELIHAIFKISSNAPLSISFLGSGGAIDEPDLVGEIVIPTIVLNGDPFPSSRNKGVLVHIIRNKAIEQAVIKTAHASVESVVVETTQWVNMMKNDRVKTVDQELFHIMDAINSSASGRKIEIFVGILVTDNVSSNALANTDVTLEHAEDVISKTVDIRREFLSKVLKKLRIVEDDRLPQRSQAK